MMPESRSIAVALAHRFVAYETKIEEVAAQLRQHKKIIDLCPLPTFMADEEGNCIYVNQAMRRVIGTTLEEMQYDRWQNYVHPADRQAMLLAWSAFVREPTCPVYEHQHRYLRTDKTEIEVLVKARQMPCKSIVGFVIPINFFSFADWLRGADLENLPQLQP